MMKRKKNKEGMGMATITSDVSNILRALNSNTMWKNSSAKLNKTITHNKNNTINNNSKNKKNIMTEEDIDRLFNRSKSKHRTENGHV